MSQRRQLRSRLGALLLIGAAGCATTTYPSPAELGNRIRIRIVSRGDIPSITTAGYWLLLLVRGPDGHAQSFGVSPPETAASGSIAVELAAKIQDVYELPPIELAESLHADDPSLVHDFVLPAGYTLDFTPGWFYAYRVVGAERRMVADLAPEIRVGQITADGNRYVELQPTGGPDLLRSEFPPGWPPKRD